MAYNQKWDIRFLCLAEQIGEWSKDPSTNCGTVIIRPDRTVASVGFNGFPKGCDDSPQLYEDRELKLSRVVHGELNAILHAREPLDGYTLYQVATSYNPFGQWGPSCDRCSAHIIQAGITRVVTWAGSIPERYIDSIIRGLQMYEEAGVEVNFLG